MSPSISQVAAGKQVQKSALPAFTNTAPAESTPPFGDILAMQLGNASAATSGRTADVLPTDRPTAQFGDAISAKLPAFRPESLQARSNAASVAAHLANAQRADAVRAERTELAAAAPQITPTIGAQIVAADSSATIRKDATAAEVSDTRPSAGDSAATSPAGATPADIAAMMAAQTLGQTAPVRPPEKADRPTEQSAADPEPLPTVGQRKGEDKAQDQMVRAATTALARDPAFATALSSAGKPVGSASLPGRSAPDNAATAPITIAQTDRAVALSSASKPAESAAVHGRSAPDSVVAKQVLPASNSEVRPARSHDQNARREPALTVSTQFAATDTAPVSPAREAISTATPALAPVLSTTTRASDKEANPVHSGSQDTLREPSTVVPSDRTDSTDAAAPVLASGFVAPANTGRDIATATPVAGKDAALKTASQTSDGDTRPARSDILGQRSERSTTSPSLPNAGQETAPTASRNAGFVAALDSASKPTETVSAAAKPAAEAAPVTTNPAGFSALTPTQSVTQPAQATVSTPFAQPAWTDDFNQKVTWVATQNLQSAELHLNPPQLGPLDVVINVNGDQATAQFSSPHAAVREAIEQAMPKLREMMADNGITLGNTTVSDQGRQGNQDANSSRQQPTPSTMREVSDNMEAGVQQPIQTAPTRRQNGLLDTFA